MSVNAGSATAYLDLDYSKYSAGLTSAKQQFNTFMDQTQESGTRIEALGGAISSVGSTLTMGVTVPLVGIGAAALTVAANFEEGMSNVQAISGATATDMEALSAKAKELGATTKFSASEAADAFSYMAMAGWKTEDMLSGISGIMDLAAASGESLATVSDICTDAMIAFGLSADQSGHFADVLAAASSNANTNVAMLGESFKYVAPVAGALGYSIEDTAVAIGILGNNGIKAGQAGTVLRSALSGMLKPSDKAAELMDKYNLSLTNTDGSTKSLAQVMDMLRTNLGSLDEATLATTASTIFGTEAMSGMLAIINTSEADYNKLTSAIKNADGTAAKMADTMQNNLKGKLTQFKSALEGAGIAIGENLLPAMTKGVEKITEMVSAFNNLDPATQKTIVGIGATAAAIGPLLMIGGKLVTGIGTTIKLVSTVTALAGAGLTTALVAVAAPLAVVAAGFYAWHEATDAANQTIAVSREEMSFMERTMADLTGMTSYSKQELQELGLVYKDFNENISADFQNSVKDMTIDIQDFGMALNEINFDGVITDEEVNNVTNRVSDALDNCIIAIDSRYTEIQSGIREAFNMDGVIDESETALLEYWSGRGETEKAEAQALQTEINNIINNARTEGRNLNPDEEAKIREYYAQIKQIELECLASNQYEIEYATQEFQNRISTMDAENGLKLLQDRYSQYEEQRLATKTNYDTLIEMARQNGTDVNGVLSEQASETMRRLEAAKEEELRVNQEKYDANIKYATENNKNLMDVFNKYTGEKIGRNDLANFREYEQMREHYDGISQVTESGYKKIYDTATGTWKDIYVSIDEITGEIKGVYDINNNNLITMTEENQKALEQEYAVWQQTEEGIITLMLAMGSAYINASGEIVSSSGEIKGKLAEIKDANGNVTKSITDLNGNPISINGNWAEAINKANEVNNAIQSIKNKTVTISVNQVGYANVKGSGYTPMYATGTESASAGIASVAEYGPELIVSRSGAMALATERSLYNMEGGETVYNARQTQEILTNMDKNTGDKDNSLLKEIINKLEGVIKTTDNLKNYISETTKAVEDKDMTPKVELDGEVLFNNTSNRLAFERKGVR